MNLRGLLSLVIAFALALSGCANKFADTDASKCGYRSAPFDQFVACIRADFQQEADRQSERPRSDYDLSKDSAGDVPNEFYTEFIGSIDQLSISYKAAKSRAKGKKKRSIEDTYYSKFDAARAEFARKQQVANQRAAAVAAVLVGGAALIAACSHGGCNGGGGTSHNISGDHQGCCSYHGGMAGVCRAGRVLCNDGNLSPTCTCP